MSGRRLLFVIGVIIGFLLLLFPIGATFWAGVAILALAALVWATFNHNEASQARWIFAVVFAPLLGVFAWYFEGRLQAIRPPAELEIAMLQRLIALLMGGFISVVLTTLFALVTIFVASVYVLSINIAEDVSIWGAFRSLLSLILGTQYDWIVISNGKIAKEKEKGVMKELGGPGKVIVDPGNAVVLQRAGRITQIRGAGVWMTSWNEKIREIFDLTNQFTVQNLTNVMTADRIPLEVRMGIGYRIVREPGPTASGLIANKDEHGSFPVRQETLLNAIYNNTEGGKWSGFGGGAPTGMLRDHFMTYTLDELFVLAPENDDVPRPNRRRISQIEQAILEAMNNFAFNNGVTIGAIDIQEIKMPTEMLKAMMLEMKSNAEARAIRRITEERNRAQQQLIDDILATIARYKAEPLDETDIQLATVFVEMSRRTMSDDVLGHEYVEMLKKLAESDGTKVFTPFPVDRNGRDMP